MTNAPLMTSEVFDILAILLPLLSVNGATFLSQRKAIKTVTANQVTFVGRLDVLQAEHQEAKGILKNVAFSHDAYRRISHIVMDASKYLSDEQDMQVNTFLMVNSNASKDCIQWAIETQLEDITFDDFMAVYNMHIEVIKEALMKFKDEDFREALRTELRCKANRYLHRQREIINDKIPNSRVLRFITASELSMQELTSTVVKCWLRHKPNQVN